MLTFHFYSDIYIQNTLVMKKILILLCLLIGLLGFSQSQLGENIDGENESDNFGRAVSLSADGSIVAIGSHRNSDVATFAGHVRVFRFESNVWVQIGDDIDGESEFSQSGSSVALSADGSIVAIGSPTNNTNGSGAGKVRVFRNENENWVQIGNAIYGQAYDSFGNSISISANGNIIAIGAYLNKNNGTASGLVQIFENQSDNWVQIGSDLEGKSVGEYFGVSVSLSSDGNLVAIGAGGNKINGTSSGQVRVFENQNGIWNQLGNEINGQSYDTAGSILNLSGYGNFLVVKFRPNNDAFNSGMVRVYQNQSNIWTQIGNDLIGDSENESFGSSFSISETGNVMAIGSSTYTNIGEYSGRVKIYQYLSGDWIQAGNDILGEAAGDRFGVAVDLSEDGSIVAIGAHLKDVFGNNTTTGHVRVFDLSSVLLVEQYVLIDFKLYPNPTTNQVTVQLENTTELKNVAIYNNLGQQVLTSKKSLINTSKLTSGLYIVEIETNKGKGSKKLIIE